MPDEKGFSLVETLIALVVLSLVGLAILGGVTTAYNSSSLASEKTAAGSLARAQIEYIQNQSYDYIHPSPVYTLPGIPSGYSDYTCVTTVARLDPLNNGLSDDDGLQMITVTVQRNSRNICTLADYKVRQ